MVRCPLRYRARDYAGPSVRTGHWPARAAGRAARDRCCRRSAPAVRSPAQRRPARTDHPTDAAGPAASITPRPPVVASAASSCAGSRRRSQRHPILYLHGGAYCVGSPAYAPRAHEHLARGRPRRIFVADYRLAPEHPCPAAVDDAVAAYRGAARAGQAPATRRIRRRFRRRRPGAGDGARTARARLNRCLRRWCCSRPGSTSAVPTAAPAPRRRSHDLAAVGAGMRAPVPGRTRCG